MKCINSSNFQEEVENSSPEYFKNSNNNKLQNKNRHKSIQNSITPINVFSIQDSNNQSNLLKNQTKQISPMKINKMDSIRNNLTNNELKEILGFNINFENNLYYNENNINSTISPKNDKDFVKTKYRNQSELNISLNFLRGKSFRKSDCNIFSVNQKKNKNFRHSIDSNLNFNYTSVARENPFGKFFKKPITFRIEEFEEKNQLEKNSKDKEFNTYAQQRFFGNSSNNFSNNNYTPDKNNTRDSFMNVQFIKNKKPIMDDIETVKLVNNKEEIIKKYVLPQIKRLTTERKDLNIYDINDTTETFVINRGVGGIFLSDILKDKSEKKKSIENLKSPLKNNNLRNIQQHYDPRSTFVNVSETKFGTFPKFLRKTSIFVKYEEPIKKVYSDEENNENFLKNIMPKKLSFNNTISLNYNNTKNTEENCETFKKNNNPNMPKNTIPFTPDIYIDNAFVYNEDKFKINNKTSSSGFISNSINIKNTQNTENNSKLINFSNKNTANDFNNKYINTNSNTNNIPINYSTKNILKNSYTNILGFGRNASRDSFIFSKKNNRKVYIDYPEIKCPIKAYKKYIKFDSKKIKKSNYLIDGSLVENVELIKEIQVLNQKISNNFKEVKDISISNEMTKNIENLNKIEKKINNLIESSRETMKENKEYKRFNSNSSIVIAE